MGSAIIKRTDGLGDLAVLGAGEFCRTGRTARLSPTVFSSNPRPSFQRCPRRKDGSPDAAICLFVARTVTLDRVRKGFGIETADAWEPALAALAAPPRRSLLGMTGVRTHLHRFWFRFDPSAQRPPAATALGCGVTGVDREDAERLLSSILFDHAELPRVLEVVQDVDVRELDPGHVLPNIGDPSIRGVWFPRA